MGNKHSRSHSRSVQKKKWSLMDSLGANGSFVVYCLIAVIALFGCAIRRGSHIWGRAVGCTRRALPKVGIMSMRNFSALANTDAGVEDTPTTISHGARMRVVTFVVSTVGSFGAQAHALVRDIGRRTNLFVSALTFQVCRRPSVSQSVSVSTREDTYRI